MGGWITDNYSWRWIFYINIPAGLLSLFLNGLLVEDPSYLKRERAALLLKGLRIDYIGISLIALGLGCLEVVLDKGQEWDWFGSQAITSLAILTVFGLIVGLIWELHHPQPFINLRLMRDRSFLVGCIIVFSTYAILYGSTLLLPQMMQGLMRYDATNAGLVLSPAGLSSMIMMILSAIILKSRADARWLIGIGGAIMALGSYWLVQLNLQAGPLQLAWPRIVQMAGAGLVFAPLAAASVLYLPKTEINNSSGLYNMLRNEGLERGHWFVDSRASAPFTAPLVPPVGKSATAEHGHDQRPGDHRAFFTQVTGDPARGQLMGFAPSAWFVTSRPMRRLSSIVSGSSP